MIKHGGNVRITELVQSIREPLLLKFVNELLINNDRVAYLGPEGSYSHEVAIQLFGGGGAMLTPLRSISDVVRGGVYQGDYGFGVIPLRITRRGGCWGGVHGGTA